MVEQHGDRSGWRRWARIPDARLHVRLALREAGRGIATVAIRAAEHDVLAMRASDLDALVAFDAALAFVIASSCV